MIDHFNIPPGALIDVPITKKQFGEKASLSSTEKRALREEVKRISMKALLQTRTTGIASYNDSDYNYDQIIFAEVEIRSQSKAAVIASMIQMTFPAPLFLIMHCDDVYCVNWCVKRINRADKNKRVIEVQQSTRFFTLHEGEPIVDAWLRSLDISQIDCSSLKELFDTLSNKLTMLCVSDEAGCFIESKPDETEFYREILESLSSNRAAQQSIRKELKSETQFNRIVKLNVRLRELQDGEQAWREQLKKKGAYGC